MSAKQLLVVDDSTSMRQMVAFALTSGGYEVREAEDGQAALEIARTRSFDAVVTDVNMPRMDGISLIRELRQLPDYRFTPLLMLTTRDRTLRVDRVVGLQTVASGLGAVILPGLLGMIIEGSPGRFAMIMAGFAVLVLVLQAGLARSQDPVGRDRHREQAEQGQR
jgi:two-component system chemotaxis response regulator CheY